MVVGALLFGYGVIHGRWRMHGFLGRGRIEISRAFLSFPLIFYVFSTKNL